jgi:hypothetical protein
VQVTESHSGSYWSTYYGEFEQQTDKGELPFIYKFQHQPKGSSKCIDTWHAPYGRSTSASGLYHNSDRTTEESGIYLVFKGDVEVEQGTYSYYRLPRSGGWGGYLSEATFAYTYYPNVKYINPGY